MSATLRAEEKQLNGVRQIGKSARQERRDAKCVGVQNKMKDFEPIKNKLTKCFKINYDLKNNWKIKSAQYVELLLIFD